MALTTRTRVVPSLTRGARLLSSRNNTPYDSLPAYLESHHPLDEDRKLSRHTMRRFVADEIIPHLPEWELARQVPRELYRKAGAAGLLGANMPEEYGGSGGGLPVLFDLNDELAKAGSGGVMVALGTHQIALPPIVATGSDAIKQRVLPPVLAGEKVAALAITEPGGGSDVAGLRTTATRDGDNFIVHGEKTFISSGVLADYYTVAVRTGGEGPGGVSLLLIEGDDTALPRSCCAMRCDAATQATRRASARRRCARWAGTAPTRATCTSTGARAHREPRGHTLRCMNDNALRCQGAWCPRPT